MRENERGEERKVDWRCIRGSVLPKRYSMLYWLTLFIETLLLGSWSKRCSTINAFSHRGYIVCVNLDFAYQYALSLFPILPPFRRTLICFEKLERHRAVLRAFPKADPLCCGLDKLNFCCGMQMRYAVPCGKSRFRQHG